MFRRSARFTFALAACAVATSVPAVVHALPPTALVGQFGPAIPLKNAAMIDKNEYGWIYKAGQQDSHVTVTYRDGRVHFADTGTRELRDFPNACRAESASVGIAVSCSVADSYTEGNPMFVQIWPRLGNDFVDASSMPAQFRMWVLADAGNDTVHTGDGDAFVNGAQGRDRVFGGSGDDWIRTGLDDDVIDGGDGNDKLVGVDGNDSVRGGDGNDRVGGGPGADTLYGGEGTDVAACGGGRDAAWLDGLDKAVECEAVTRS